MTDLIPGALWYAVKDGDARARHLFDRHYSRHFYKDNRKPRIFVGPGEKMVLLTLQADALFVWRKFISLDNQDGINCAIFRNESRNLSSHLILEAEQLACNRWPNERFYTYVNADKITSSNPGYCFKMAGWRECGRTSKGLVILEKLPTQEALDD